MVEATANAGTNKAIQDVSSSVVVTVLPTNETIVKSNGSSVPLVASALGSVTTGTTNTLEDAANHNPNHHETLTNGPTSVVVQQDPISTSTSILLGVPENGTIITRERRQNRKRPATSMINSSEPLKKGKTTNGDDNNNENEGKANIHSASLEESSLSENTVLKDSVPPPTTTMTTTTKMKDRFLNSMSWLCMECKEAEAALDVDSMLLLCEGKCNRPFHLVCVGLKEAPPSWICTDCRDERHICSICQEYGIDQVDVFLCKNRDCGLFFHESCLSMLNVNIKQVVRPALAKKNGITPPPVITTPPAIMTTTTTTTDGDNHDGQNNGNGIMMPDEITMPEFRCPAHRCWTCTEEIVIKDENDNENQSRGVTKKTKGKKKKATKSKDNAFGVKTGLLIVSDHRLISIPLVLCVD
jgi:hypothetical protein